MRTIKLQIESETMDQIAEIVTYEQLNAAIGYLSRWAAHAPEYEEVQITSRWPNEGELLAMYGKAGFKQPAVVIGAIWHASGDAAGAGYYGFHS